MLKDTNNILVYHGSYVVVKDINLDFAKKSKDFGRGFYVTTNKKQAEKFAKLVAKKYRKNKGYINTYLIKDFNKLEVYELKTVDKKWLNCIVGFRDSSYNELTKEYANLDIIIGKVADDDTSLVINTYIAGVYGKTGSEDASDTAIKRLIPKRLNNQICFKTNKAIKKLTYVRSEEIIL